MAFDGVVFGGDGGVVGDVIVHGGVDLGGRRRSGGNSGGGNKGDGELGSLTSPLRGFQVFLNFQR